MRKKYLLLMLFCFLCILSGCSSLTVNEIHRQKYEIINSDLKTLEDETKEVYENCRKGVIGVLNYATEWDYGTDNHDSHGSGFIVEQGEGTYRAITNYHVVKGASKIKIMLYDGKEAEADILKKDPQRDLVLLEFKSEGTYPSLAISEDKLKTGQFAFAMGSPISPLYSGSITMGIISSAVRNLTDDNHYKGSYIQTDVAINHGNSGGPLLNIKGEVTGVVVERLESKEGDEGPIVSMGFAIPAYDVIKFINEDDSDA